MRFVDQKPGIEHLLDADETGQVREIAVHAVDALDRDQHAIELVPVLAQQMLQRIEVAMGKVHSRRMRKARALAD